MAIPSQKRMGMLGFGLVWLLLNTAGWGLGFSLQAVLIHPDGGSSFAALGGMLLTSAVIGLAQWLGLRWLLPRLGRGSDGIAYVILTIFGFTAGLVFGGLVTGLVSSETQGWVRVGLTSLGWAVVGLAVGAMQWFLLRAAARGAGWWIGANGLGFSLGTVLISSMPAAEGLGRWGYALAGLVVGTTTLVALARLRKPPRPKAA